MIVGLGHISRTGKDTFADLLVEELSNRGRKATKASLAGPLKEVCFSLFSHIGIEQGCSYEGQYALDKDSKTLIGGRSPREVWIWVGEQMRVISPNVWIEKLVEKNWNSDFLIIPDVRHFNECDYIKGVGGATVEITRPGVVAKNDLDKQLLNYEWDYRFTNDDTIDDLRLKAIGFVKGALL